MNIDEQLRLMAELKLAEHVLRRLPQLVARLSYERRLGFAERLRDAADLIDRGKTCRRASSRGLSLSCHAGIGRC
jgi:hypothetical protein